MNMIGGSNMQRSEGQHTFVHSEQVQDRELPDNLTSSTFSSNSSLSRDFSQNKNFLSSDDSHQDKQKYENASRSQTSESFFEESQEPNEDSSNISSSNQKKSINNQYYSVDSNSQIEPDVDLVECITGLYRLLDLCKDDCSSELGKCFLIILI